MSLTVEEIRLKLGLDDKEIDEGTRRALAKLSNFSKEAGESISKYGEKPARAFRSALRELTDQFPLLGGAARAALSPIGGTLAVAVTAAITLTREIGRMKELLDKVGDVNAKSGIRGIAAALLGARRGDAEDSTHIRDTEIRLDDPLARQMSEARTGAQRQSLLKDILARRHTIDSRLTAYASGKSARDADRRAAAMAGQTADTASEHIQGLQEMMASTKDSALTVRNARESGWDALGISQKALAGWKVISTMGNIGAESTLYEAAEKAIKAETANMNKAKDKQQELTLKLEDQLKDYDRDAGQMEKLNSARLELEEKIRTQSALQSAYNQQMAVAYRNQNELKAGPFTPGIAELAGYQGPYSYIAREVMASRDLAKRQAGFANPTDMYGLRQQVNAAQYDLGNEWRGATTYEGRQAALRKYGERMQGLISGRTTPEHQLEVIADHIKSLDEQAKKDGLIVVGKDGS